MDVLDENVSKQEKAKFLAAKKVAQDFIFDGFTVGVGTGSTIKYFTLKQISQKQSFLEIKKEKGGYIGGP